MSKPSSRAQALTTSEFKFYLNQEVYLSVYQDIRKPGSDEADVHEFYVMFLGQMFPPGDGFRFRHDSVFQKPSLGRADIIIRHLQHGDRKAVVICEAKSRDKESQDGEWVIALRQAVGYAKTARVSRIKEEPVQTEPIYLTVNIGTYLRFYVLRSDEQTARDWEPAGGRLFELADDEEEVWNLWQQLRSVVDSEYK